MGFTLVEMMIVVAIIAVLGSIAIANFSGSRDAAVEQGMKSDVNHGLAALEAYYARNNQTYVGATAANLAVTMSPNNTLTVQNATATSATIKVNNSAQNTYCLRTTGSAASSFTCGTGAGP